MNLRMGKMSDFLKCGRGGGKTQNSEKRLGGEQLPRISIGSDAPVNNT